MIRRSGDPGTIAADLSRRPPPVRITYTERLTIHVEAAGTPELATETTTSAAKPVSVSELVVFTQTQAMAVSVQKVAAKKK